MKRKVEVRNAALVLTLVLAGCASSSDGHWHYALSREFYDVFELDLDEDTQVDPMAACVFVALYSLPFVVDTLLLPITGTHDLLFVE